MATDLKNTSEDAEMAEYEGEKVVTMMDVLKEQEDFEEDANAVLGGSDDKNCTYSKGYIKRQALYACLTCCSEAKSDPEKRAGVCLACSLVCHENHELIELYTKRNFRCDCGNPKFNSHPCTFTPNKTDLNEDNSYNQNFSGVYCICKRPYPDPEATVEDEMIQCIICEDWLHSSHLEATVPANDQYSEMICKQCMEKNKFLHDYGELAVNIETTIEIVHVNGNDSHNELSNGNGNKNEMDNSTLNKNDTSNINVDVEMSEKAEKEKDIPTENKTGTEDEIIAEKSNKDEESEKMDENATSAENNLSTTQDSLKEIDDKVVQNLTDNVTETNFEESSAKTQEECLNNINTELNTDENKSDNETEKAKIQEDEGISKDDETVTTSSKEDKSDTEVTAEINNQSTAKSEDLEIADSNKNKPGLDLADQEPKATVENLDSSKDKDINVSDEEKHRNKEEEAEKMEEDRLLADPEEESKSNSKDNQESTDKNNTESNSSEPTNKEEVTSELTKVESEFTSENKETNKNIQEENKCNNLVDTEMKSDENVCSESEPKLIEKTNENSNSEDNEKLSESEEKHSEKRKLSIEESAEDLETKKPKLDTESKHCLRPRGVKKVYKGATFWPSNFRQKLCSCPECISMYKDLSVLFLTDPEDTVSAYENLGKDIINGKPLTQYEKGLEALSSLDRIQQINALTEYNKMRDKLLDFLKSFKDRKEIVKEEDIKAFFADMKPKREPDGVYFCR
ncbi:unnamed protein product, partial [Brenthis ino]